MVDPNYIAGALGGTTLNTPEDIDAARKFAYWQAMTGMGSRMPFGWLQSLNANRGLENIANQQAASKQRLADKTTNYVGPLLPGGTVSANTLGQPNATASPVQKADVASVRNNNPGAQWPGPIASQYGATGSQNIAGGNKIATFADPVQGAAAQFALLAKNYAGMPLGQAIAKWSGGNNVQGYLQSLKSTGLSPNTVITPQLLASPQGLALVKAMAQHEAGKPFPLDDNSWQKAQQLVFGGGQSTPATPGASLAAVPAAAQTQQAGASNLPGPQVSNAEAAQAWSGQQPQMNLGGPSPDASLGPGAGGDESDPNISGGIDQNAPMGIGAGGVQVAQANPQSGLPDVPLPPRSNFSARDFHALMADPRIPDAFKQAIMTDLLNRAQNSTYDMGDAGTMIVSPTGQKSFVPKTKYREEKTGDVTRSRPMTGTPSGAALRGSIINTDQNGNPIQGNQPGQQRSGQQSPAGGDNRYASIGDFPENGTPKQQLEWLSAAKSIDAKIQKENEIRLSNLGEVQKEAIANYKMARSTIDLVEKLDELEKKKSTDKVVTGPLGSTWLNVAKTVNGVLQSYGYKGLGDPQAVTAGELLQGIGIALAANQARRADANPTQKLYEAMLQANPGLMNSPQFRRVLTDTLRHSAERDIKVGKIAQRGSLENLIDAIDQADQEYEPKFKELADRTAKLTGSNDKTTVTKGKRGRLVQKPDGTTVRMEEVNGQWVEIPEGN